MTRQRVAVASKNRWAAAAGVPTRSRVGRAGIATPPTLFANNAVAFHIPAGVPVRADMMAEET
jgi:hypothetical protein